MDDLEQLMKMLDQAMTSDDPRVKDTFRKLMMIVALTQTDDKREPGPIAQMRNEMMAMNTRIQALHQEIQMVRQQLVSRPYNPQPYSAPGTPWWGTGTGLGGNINCSTTAASGGLSNVTITKVGPDEVV